MVITGEIVTLTSCQNRLRFGIMFRSGIMLKNSSVVANAKPKLPFRERIKGTFLEKWANYWKSLYADYKSMVVDLKTEMQDKPKKAIVVLSSIGVAIQMSRNNPDEIDYRESVRHYNNQLLLVGESCRNPKTVKHFKDLEKYSNQGILRRTNLGILSVLWVDDYTEECSLYKTKCDYIQPKYVSFPSRIVDVGMFGRWWNMYIKFQDFDIDE